MKQKIILHIDFDSFFASVEQQYDPSLRGKPIGVTAHNGRTAIIAASREAKKSGLKNIMRTYDAFKICPSLKLVKADFNKYWDVSKKFINIAQLYSPYIEVFSIDELFMDVTLTANLFGGTDLLIKKIKKQIAQEIGEYITVSVGVSHNKLLSKLASGMRKPDGVFEIKESQIEEVYRDCSLTDICGIGHGIEKRLNKMGIFTLLKLRETPLSSLIIEFGNVQGRHLHNISFGIDTLEVRPFSSVSDAKSIGRSYCLPHNEYDKRIVAQNVYELCEELGIKLRRLSKKARTAGIYLRGTKEIKGRKTYSNYFCTGRDVFHAVTKSLDGNLLTSGYVRQIGVWVSGLEDSNNLTMSFLQNDNKWDRVVEAVDKLNERFGDHTVRNGYLLYADKLTTVPNGFMADRYERQKLAEEAF